MYDNILFPTDGSEPAENVLDYAIEIAAEHEATIHLLNVADTTRDSLTRIQGEVIDVLEREGAEIVDDAAQRASDRGIAVVSDVVQGTPSTSIIEYGTRYDIDLIVMPTHGRRGLKRFLLGSVTERVINTAEIPVVTVNPDHDRPLTYPSQDILVPIDGSRGAELALSEGIAVAKATDATLHLLHVVESASLGPEYRSDVTEGEPPESANAILSEAAARARSASVGDVETDIEYGSPAKKIRQYIRENHIGIAVLCTHGKTDFSRYMMGGVSSKIVRTSPIPVMWVREPASNETA
jgi:nucleotide-binding universal stress UspA family protein